MGYVLRHPGYRTPIDREPNIQTDVHADTWAPAGMGRGHLLPPGKCCKVFLCIVVECFSRRSIYALFQNLSLAFGGFALGPTGAPLLGLAGRLSFSIPLICPPWKKSCGRPYADRLLLTGYDILLGL